MKNFIVKRVLIISDSHNLWRESLEKYCQNVDLILHAGDIGSLGFVEKLEKFAKVIAVHGNCDNAEIKQKFPLSHTFLLNNKLFFMTHFPTIILPEVDGKILDYAIFGHTHRTQNEVFCDVSLLNPGSCGPLRFGLPPSAIILTFDVCLNGFLTEFVTLN